jgi:hypothetical protein
LLTPAHNMYITIIIIIIAITCILFTFLFHISHF